MEMRLQNLFRNIQAFTVSLEKRGTQDNTFVADTKSFEQAEKELRFIFFDGDKDRKEDNLKKRVMFS